MKILHVIDSAGIYGAEVMLLNLMKEQVNIGLTPVLLSVGSKDEGSKEIETETESLHIKVVKFRSGNGPLLIFKSLQVLYSGSKTGYNLIHCHGYKGNIMFGILPKALRKIPVISTMHGWLTINKQSKIWFYETLDRFCLKRLDARVFVTQGHAGLIDAVSTNRTNNIVIENGISKLIFNDKKIIEKEKQFIDFCKNHYVIGAVGRLSPEKGFEHLISSIEILLGERPDYGLVIIGEGNERKQLEEQIEGKGLSSKIFLLGYRERAFDFLKFFDAFVISSLTEGLPITLLEAMQAKCPIVATRVGGIPKALDNGKCGMIVTPKSAQEIARQIRYFREHPVMVKKITQYAYDFVLKRYSIQRMASEYLSVYNDIIGE